MRYICLLVCLLAMACKSEKSTPEIMLHSKDIPADFLDFYHQFHSDSTYQMEHIIFPLSGKSDTTRWQKETWTLHRPFDNTTGEFVREFTNLNSIIFELIVSKDKTYSMERRFSKSGNTYNLIYYSVRNAFEGSDFEQIIE